MSDTPEEAAAINMGKVRTAAALVRCAQELIPVVETATSLYREYWNVIAGEISEEELAQLDISAATLTNTVTLLENLVKFASNEAPAQANYWATLDAIRRVGAQI